MSARLRLSLGRSFLIARRELIAAFDSAIAPVAIIVSLLFVTTAFMNGFFLAGRVEMASFFARLPLFLALLVPALTMRLFAEEKKTRTIELLFSLPLSTGEAVLGKFLASLGLVVLFLMGTLTIPALLAWLGDPDGGAIVSGYLGLLCLSAELCALGLFFSALARDQIVAFVAAAVTGSALILFGDPRVKSALDGLSDNPHAAPGTRLAEWLSPAGRLFEFDRGVVSLGSLFFFASFTVFFLWAAGFVLDRERE